MFASRFFRRLFLPYLLLIFAATALVGVFAAVQLREAHLKQSQDTLAGESQLAAEILRNSLAPEKADELKGKVGQLSQALHCQVTVINTDGSVLADSQADVVEQDNSARRPEIIQAEDLGQGSSVRTSASGGVELLYLAHKTTGADAKIYYVRLAVPLAVLNHELHLLYATLISVALVAMSMAAVISYYFASRQTAPVRELASFAEALARGEMGRRLIPGGMGEIGTLTTSLNSMADSLSSLLSQLANERSELRAILASMNEGVIATDTRQRVVLVNERAAEMLEFPRDSAQGKPLWELVRNEPILSAADEVLATGERRMFQISPSAGRYLEIAACIFPSSGKAEGLVLVAHDTTKSVRYQELRKEFVANVSHELRTPLTVIRGFTETLLDGALQDPVNGPKFLATISKHTDQLQNLVSDLLELSRLESSPEMPRRVSMDLAGLTRRVVDLLTPTAQKKHQALSLEITGHLPRILGNPDYLERAISNLVDNAIKYTPENGAVGIMISSNNEAVTIEVHDNGIGIPTNDLDRIFERFYRVDRSRSREMGGTGLGLSIVKHVAQVHGGTVEVTSTPGIGSKFRLRIPLSQDE